MAEGPTAYTYTKEPGHFQWFSQRVLGDLLSEQGKAEYRKVLGEISDDNFQMVMQMPVGRIIWAEDYYGQFETDFEMDMVQQYGRLAWLNFGGPMAIMQQKFDTV